MMDLTNKTREELLDLAESTEALKERYRTRYIEFLFPEEGKYSRKAYKGAMEFFKAGADHGLRMLGGCNGSGKSFNGAFELVLHLTGEYPDWWEGKRQACPHHWWIVSESANTFKSSLQRLLIGDTLNDEDYGTGLIPKERLVGYTGWQSVAGAVSSIQVRHRLGHIVTLEVKSSDQKRENLQAANLDGVLFDEEPPQDIYTECVMRLRGSPKKPPGIGMLLFTPLKGLSTVVLNYLVNGSYPQYGEHPNDPDKYVVRIDYMDVPHLTEADRRRMYNESPPNERCARLHGIPALGSGRVYPVNEEDIVVNYLKIQPHWPRAYGLDFGWHKTAAVWIAKDPETGIYYIYGEYYQGEKAPYIHTYAIQERGKWIPGLCDPRGDKASEKDGSRLIDEYRNLGLEIEPGVNAVQAGVAKVLQLLESGLLKVTYNCENWITEFRTYRYDTKDPNKIAPNQNDHLMDATKYVLSRFDDVAISALEAEQDQASPVKRNKFNPNRNQITGY
jgi:phage terminase large subunit-like protein